MPWCGFLHVYFACASWSFLDTWVYSFHQIWGIFSHYLFLQLIFSVPSSFFSFWRQYPGSEDCYTCSAGSFPRSLIVFSCMCADQYSAKGSLVWQWRRACVRIMLHETETVSWIHLWETLNSWPSNMDFNKKGVGSGWRYSHVVWSDWCAERSKVAAAGEHTELHQNGKSWHYVPPDAVQYEI